MNTLAFRVIKNAEKHCSEKEKYELVQKLVKDMYWTCHVAQKEGLLVLEELALDNYYGYLGEEINGFIKEALCSVVDGVGPEELRNNLERKICALGEDCFAAYLCYIAMIGTVGIRVGYKEDKVLEYLLKCVPNTNRKAIVEKIKQKGTEMMAEPKASDAVQYSEEHYSEEHYSEEDKCMQVQKLVEDLYQICQVVHRESLLALLGLAYEKSFAYLGDEVNDFIKEALCSVADGVYPEKLVEKLEHKICSLGEETFNAHLCYVAMTGILSIQSGDKESVFLNKVLELVPEECRKAIEEKFDKEAKQKKEEYDKKMAGWTEHLQLDSDNEILRQIKVYINDISEYQIARIAREVKDHDLIELLPYLDQKKRLVFAEALPEKRRKVILTGIQQKVTDGDNSEVALLKSLISFMAVLAILKLYGEIL